MALEVWKRNVRSDAQCDVDEIDIISLLRANRTDSLLSISG